MQNGQFESKIKIPKNMSKIHSRRTFRVVLCKKRLEKTLKYSRNERILKIGHFAKPIAFAKSSVWVKN